MSWKGAVGLIVGGLLLGGVASVAAQTEAPVPEQAVPEVRMHFRGGPEHHKGGFGGPEIRSERVLEGVNGGAVRTVRTDSGELKAIDGSTLTIAEADGTEVKVTVGDDTQIVRDGATAELSDLKAGDRVHTVREKTGDEAFVTRHVHAISAERYAEMQQQRSQMEQQRQACASDPTQCPVGPGRGAFGRGFGGPMGGPPEIDAAPAPASA